jgi:glycosyltransferase involved in cell wall biosynthesis
VRILHVAPNISRAYGGPTYSLAAYARASIDAGATVTIAAPEPPAADRWLANELPDVTLHGFRTYGRDAFLASPALHRWLGENGESFDVIHVHGLLNPVSSLAARACARNGWPFIIRPFGTLSRYTYSHRRGALKEAYSRRIDRPNLRRASAIHFTTTVERDESAWQGIDWGQRAFVIPPPWVASKAVAPRTVRNKRRTVLFLSRLHPVKRVDLLLAAWPLVTMAQPDAKLIIAGQGEPNYVRELRALAEPLGDSVRFVGFVEGKEKAALLGEADVFVLPSQHENFGIAVLEALAFGLPVVLTKEVQLSGFVAEHSLGVISGQPVEALASAIGEALADDVLTARCREHGPSLVARYFSLVTVGQQLLDMYRFSLDHSPSLSI